MTKPKKRRDKYDRAIAYLRKHPSKIGYAWGSPYTRKGGVLFKVCGARGCGSGCPTQIRFSPLQFSAVTTSLQNAIANDLKIPDASYAITPAHLPRFAYWQRRVDAAMRRAARVKVAKGKS